MGKIKVLDKKIAELIAAGEIIERPSSVVKELVENSIDAGAKKISVEIKFGGTKFIRVTDDGCGILRDDIENAFLPHATSKIHSEDDLEKIHTLGFRGEALSSIATVSKVRLKTLSREEKIGSCYEINFSNKNLLTDCGHPVGTEFEVYDIFYNMPARMKFLKNCSREGQNVGSLLEKLALSHPEISFKFVRDGKNVFTTLGDGSLKSAVFTVFGKNFFETLIPVEYEYEYVKIYGFVGSPESAKSNKLSQHFFINGRYVKLKVGGVALDEAYSGEILHGRFPTAILHISISPEALDVNVHPSKTEIKFFDEKIIFNIIFYAAKTALDKYKHSVFPLTSEEKISESHDDELSENVDCSNLKFSDEQINTFDSNSENQNDFIISKSVLESEVKLIDAVGIDRINVKESAQENTIYSLPKNSNVEDDRINVTSEKKITVQESNDFVESKQNNIKIIGEIFNTYIIGELENKLILIDKHAAHERLIFEQLKSSDEFKNPHSQILATPITVNLNSDEYFSILEKSSDLEKVGFMIEDFGENMILVRAVPAYLSYNKISQEITEISDYIVENRKNLDTNFFNWLKKNIACRSAIKAGNMSSNIEIVNLIKRLCANPEIIHCPHGRPIYVILDENFLKKQFCRT